MKFAISSHKRFDRTGILENAKTLWWIPILNLIIMFLLIPANNSMPLFDHIYPVYYGPFSLYDSHDLLLTATVLLAVITAFGCFSFLFNKKHQTAMLITGGKRSSLFISRFIYGLLSLFVPIIIAMGTTVAINFIVVLPDTYFIIRNSLIITGLLFLIVFAVFSAASLIAALIGRKTEFFAFNFFWIVFVWAVFFTVGNILEAFLNGIDSSLSLYSPYSFPSYILAYRFPNAVIDAWQFSILTVFIDVFYLFSDFHFHKYIAEMPPSSISPGNTLVSTYPSQEQIITTYSVPILPIIAVLLFGVLTAVGAYFAFCKRNAEIAEKPNSNKPLSIAFSAVISTAIASSLLFFVKNPYLSILLFLITFFVLYFLLYGLCRASLRRFWKSYRAPVITALISLALIFTMIFGCFGYTSYIPAVSEVENVAITLGGAMSTNFAVVSEEDILKIEEMHKQAIAANSRFTPENDGSYTLAFSYKLKNGKKVKRYYGDVGFAIASSIVAFIPEDELDDEYGYYAPDPSRTDWPSEQEALDALYEGMSYRTMIKLLGKPYDDIGSGISIFLYKLSNGKTLYVSVVYGVVQSFYTED